MSDFTGIGMKSRREALGLSQNWLASTLGVHQVQIARWEAGERTPRTPEEINGLLERLEDEMARLTDELLDQARSQEGTNPVLEVCRTDEQFWAADEKARESALPAAFQRIAAARAATRLRVDRGVEPRIDLRA